MFGSLKDKKRQRVSGKKTLVKNLCAIDFLPSWSSPYHPASHHPRFPPSVLCCVVCVPGEIFHSGKIKKCSNSEVKFQAKEGPEVWQGFSVRKQGEPIVWSMLIGWHQTESSIKANMADKCWKEHKKTNKKNPQTHEYLKQKDKALENSTVKGSSWH